MTESNVRSLGMLNQHLPIISALPLSTAERFRVFQLLVLVLHYLNLTKQQGHNTTLVLTGSSDWVVPLTELKHILPMIPSFWILHILKASSLNIEDERF